MSLTSACASALEAAITFGDYLLGEIWLVNATGATAPKLESCLAAPGVVALQSTAGGAAPFVGLAVDLELVRSHGRGHAVPLFLANSAVADAQIKWSSDIGGDVLLQSLTSRVVTAMAIPVPSAGVVHVVLMLYSSRREEKSPAAYEVLSAYTRPLFALAGILAPPAPSDLVCDTPSATELSVPRWQRGLHALVRFAASSLACSGAEVWFQSVTTGEVVPGAPPSADDGESSGTASSRSSASSLCSRRMLHSVCYVLPKQAGEHVLPNARLSQALCSSAAAAATATTPSAPAAPPVRWLPTPELKAFAGGAGPAAASSAAASSSSFSASASAPPLPRAAATVALRVVVAPNCGEAVLAYPVPPRVASSIVAPETGESMLAVAVLYWDGAPPPPVLFNTSIGVSFLTKALCSTARSATLVTTMGVTESLYMQLEERQAQQQSVLAHAMTSIADPTQQQLLQYMALQQIGGGVVLSPEGVSAMAGLDYPDPVAGSMDGAMVSHAQLVLSMQPNSMAYAASAAPSSIAYLPLASFNDRDRAQMDLSDFNDEMQAGIRAAAAAAASAYESSGVDSLSAAMMAARAAGNVAASLLQAAENGSSSVYGVNPKNRHGGYRPPRAAGSSGGAASGAGGGGSSSSAYRPNSTPYSLHPSEHGAMTSSGLPSVAPQALARVKGRLRASAPKVSVALRRGKWPMEEEEFTSIVVETFRLGLLPLADGTTLRTFLSGQLHCAPMRITKKFNKDSSIGKQVFKKRTDLPNWNELAAVAVDKVLSARDRFFSSVLSRSRIDLTQITPDPFPADGVARDAGGGFDGDGEEAAGEEEDAEEGADDEPAAGAAGNGASSSASAAPPRGAGGASSAPGGGDEDAAGGPAAKRSRSAGGAAPESQNPPPSFPAASGGGGAAGMRYGGGAVLNSVPPLGNATSI